MLTTRDIQNFLVINQFTQGDVIQEAGQTVAQIAPQRVGQALIAALTAAFTLATGRVNGFVNRANHFANRNTARVFTQQITAARATNAGHQSIFTQSGEQLFQVREGDPLSFRNISQRNRARFGVERNVQHRGHGITPFRCQSHVLLNLKLAPARGFLL
jgi:phage-related tail fiber protein